MLVFAVQWFTAASWPATMSKRFKRIRRATEELTFLAKQQGPVFTLLDGDELRTKARNRRAALIKLVRRSLARFAIGFPIDVAYRD